MPGVSNIRKLERERERETESYRRSTSHVRKPALSLTHTSARSRPHVMLQTRARTVAVPIHVCHPSNTCPHSRSAHTRVSSFKHVPAQSQCPYTCVILQTRARTVAVPIHVCHPSNTWRTVGVPIHVCHRDSQTKLQS